VVTRGFMTPDLDLNLFDPGHDYLDESFKWLLFGKPFYAIPTPARYYVPSRVSFIREINFHTQTKSRIMCELKIEERFHQLLSKVYVCVVIESISVLPINCYPVCREADFPKRNFTLGIKLKEYLFYFTSIITAEPGGYLVRLYLFLLSATSIFSFSPLLLASFARLLSATFLATVKALSNGSSLDIDASFRLVCERTLPYSL